MYCIILSTTSNIEEAEKIAHALVESKFAACVNIIPKIKSVYRWEEKVQNEEECLLLIKAKEAYFKKIELKIKELHSYKVPEIIMLPFNEGSKDYLS